ncbi:MAG: hypothetical protein AAGJ32_02720 [Pseudomonadota bacterium]
MSLKESPSLLAFCYTRGFTMYALIAIGAVVALFAILNLIDFKRID